MRSQFRALGMIISGGAIVAANVLAYLNAPRGTHFSLVDLLHFALPLAIYCLVNFAIDEGRARERRARGVQED
ncbi:uncharacterized protein SOCE26_038380 [Sorangium cellulosum]|uniref:Uncharacterized protein n=1 Tax=Sorangium cellulosum TaxID=56 RepID=A0A2L0ESX4_SORCE|nr:hypothetical protein [Sorangium cellulosum]AUX42407.1 uncharacterized protein SOCE26_038380 [Sorangium cellulosum]